MKIYTTILLLMVMCPAHGQQSKFSIDPMTIPDGVTMSIDTVHKPQVYAKREVKAQVIFSTANKSVSYWVFDFKQADSLAFKDVHRHRLLSSNCLWGDQKSARRRARKARNGFTSGVTLGDHYFLLESCPIYDVAFASKLNKWWREVGNN